MLGIGNNSAESSDDENSSNGDMNDDEITEDEDFDQNAFTKNEIFRTSLAKWALKFNINHMAMKDLLEIINKRFGKNAFLPEDPRTLLKTPQTVTLMPLSDGEYWHHGLDNCLKKTFAKLSGPISISLNINIDGLPIFNSSKVEFWPILFNIAEMTKVPAMVIGIFCGKSKTVDIDSFLTPFTEEMRDITTNGVYVNSHKITVRIRCFVCDSPARAYVKGEYENWRVN